MSIARMCFKTLSNRKFTRLMLQNQSEKLMNAWTISEIWTLQWWTRSWSTWLSWPSGAERIWSSSTMGRRNRSSTLSLSKQTDPQQGPSLRPRGLWSQEDWHPETRNKKPNPKTDYDYGEEVEEAESKNNEESLQMTRVDILKKILTIEFFKKFSDEELQGIREWIT